MWKLINKAVLQSAANFDGYEPDFSVFCIKRIEQ